MTSWHVGFWDRDERPILLLVSQEVFDALPNGTILWSINGERKVKGKDDFDFDTRGGLLAYGVHIEYDRDPLGRSFELQAAIDMTGLYRNPD